MIALLATVVPLSLYLAGYSWTARMLFCRWRPSRVPLCGGTHRTVDGYIRNHHVNNCYRRLKADHMPVRIDSDSHAAGWAAFAALAWPAVLIGLALMASPPELPAEKERRLRDLEKRNAELEQEAGLGSADHH